MTALVVAWALLAAGFTGVALVRLWRRPPAAPRRVRRRPHVLLLRPVDAPTPLELDALSARVDYAGPLTHYVVSPFRPRLTSANVRWLPSDPLTRNRKVGHLRYARAALEAELQRDTVVIAVDADVRVDGALLGALVDGVLGGAALCTAAPRPEVSRSLLGRAVRGLLVQSHHAFAALDVMQAGAKAVCGKAMAFSPAGLAVLDGLGDCIGEDLELSVQLHARGLAVVLAAAPAVVPQPERPAARDVLARFTRWLQVLRAHRPALFPSVPLLFAPTPVLMVGAAFVATPAAAVALALLVGGRIVLAQALEQEKRLPYEWLLAELLLWACWLGALWRGRVVRWRGRTFALESGGRMEALPAPEVAS